MTPIITASAFIAISGARNFEEGSTHNKVPERLSLIKTNKLSCISSGCHEFVHDIASLKDATFWKEKP